MSNDRNVDALYINVVQQVIQDLEECDLSDINERGPVVDDCIERLADLVLEMKIDLALLDEVVPLLVVPDGE